VAAVVSFSTALFRWVSGLCSMIARLQAQSSTHWCSCMIRIW
jgi:hypothetical protein